MDNQKAYYALPCGIIGFKIIADKIDKAETPLDVCTAGSWRFAWGDDDFHAWRGKPHPALPPSSAQVQGNDPALHPLR
jgi:hypothetical protein